MFALLQIDSPLCSQYFSTAHIRIQLEELFCPMDHVIVEGCFGSKLI